MFRHVHSSHIECNIRAELICFKAIEKVVLFHAIDIGLIESLRKMEANEIDLYDRFSCDENYSTEFVEEHIEALFKVISHAIILSIQPFEKIKFNSPH